MKVPAITRPRIEKGCPCCRFAGRGCKSCVSISVYPSDLSFSSNSISFILFPLHLHLHLHLQPHSTRRRTASDRPSVSSCLPAQLSTVSRNSFDKRIAVTGSWPVAGRPARFRTTFFIDDAIENVRWRTSFKYPASPSHRSCRRPRRNLWHW